MSTPLIFVVGDHMEPTGGRAGSVQRPQRKARTSLRTAHFQQPARHQSEAGSGRQNLNNWQAGLRGNLAGEGGEGP